MSDINNCKVDKTNNNLFPVVRNNRLQRQIMHHDVAQSPVLNMVRQNHSNYTRGPAAFWPSRPGPLQGPPSQPHLIETVAKRPEVSKLRFHT